MATATKNGNGSAPDELTLRTKFPANKVKYRSQGGKELAYVSIDATIDRILDVAKKYDFKVNSYTHALVEWRGKPQWAATCHCTLTINGESHDGLGGSVWDDLDNALKTAQAEAYKKAGHTFGIGLELWDEEHRDAVAKVRDVAAIVSNDLSLKSLKNGVTKLAKNRGVVADPNEIAAHFGIKVEQLQDATVLTKILTDNGVI